MVLNTPNLLRRPLRTRRRMSNRRKSLICCVVGVPILVLFCILNSLSTSSGTSGDNDAAAPNPNISSKRSEVGLQLFLEKGKSENFNATMQDHELEKAWRDPDTGTIYSFSSSKDIVMTTPFISLHHLRDTAGNPSVNTHRAWSSYFAPAQKYSIPHFAQQEERNTLSHASIFVSIASYRDPDCLPTLRSVYQNVKSPHRIYVGLSEERLPIDASCLAFLDFENGEMNTSRQVLYGPDSPSNLQLEVRRLSWEDVTKPHRIIDSSNPPPDATAIPGGSVTQVPPGIFLSTDYKKETITCIAGELETRRDRLRLAERDRYEAAVREGRTVEAAKYKKFGFREGKGGPQMRPSAALAGCRIISRLAPTLSARGPTFARYISSLFYFNQDYYLVIDSHTHFAVDWDFKMIARIFQLPTKGILSHYPNGYRTGHETEEFDKKDIMLMCKAVILSNGMPKLGALWYPVGTEPKLEGFAAAGYMFGDAQYVLDVPFDPFLPFIFDGEEVLFSARLWTNGWDIYNPAEMLVFHYYVRLNSPSAGEVVVPGQALIKLRSERRALYFLQRAIPWAQELVTRGIMAANGTVLKTPVPPYEPPETRLIVSEKEVAATPGISMWENYYGMGQTRRIADYWIFTELADDFVKTRDSELRWEGGTGLCFS